MKGTLGPVWSGILAIAAFLAVVPLAAGERVRPSALAGGWYPQDAEELAAYVDAALQAARVAEPGGVLRALVAPHAGYRYSGATAAEVFSLVQGRRYERVIVLAPSHRSGFHGLSIADVDAYETPLGPVPLDRETIARLRESDLVGSDPGAHAREHAIEIELPMLQRSLAPGWRLVPILVGRLEPPDYRRAADLLRPFADETTLVVVSSDFTHFGPRFGFVPFPLDDDTPARIRALDDGAVDRILAGDPEGLLAYQARTGITVCGLRPLVLLLHLLPPGAEVVRVSYTTSGELTGDYGNSVSYVALAITSPEPFSQAAGEARRLEDTDLRLLHRLAILAVDGAVRGPSEDNGNEVEDALNDLPRHLRDPAGAFVTLKREGRLRGCVGYILPRKPLYQAVLENGGNAAVQDRRFRPVTPEELADLEVEVSVLSPPEPIPSHEQFRVGEQGVILRKDGRQAVFLPEVASEQGWTREETLSHLARKAGLPGDAWRDGATLEVFTSTKYSAPFPAEGGAAGE